MHWTIFSFQLLICTCFFSLKNSFVYFIGVYNAYALSPKPLYEVCFIHFIFSSPTFDQQYDHTLVVVLSVVL